MSKNNGNKIINDSWNSRKGDMKRFGKTCKQRTLDKKLIKAGLMDDEIEGWIQFTEHDLGKTLTELEKAYVVIDYLKDQLEDIRHAYDTIANAYGPVSEKMMGYRKNLVEARAELQTIKGEFGIERICMEALEKASQIAENLENDG